MSWERVYPFRSTTINKCQTPAAVLEKESILWFKHDKFYCKRCVVWGWRVCSLALTKCSRNPLYFHLYRFAMNRFKLNPVAVAIQSLLIDTMISLRPSTSLYACVHPIFCDSETSNHLTPAEWSPPKEMFLIILLCINIFTFSNHMQMITCSLQDRFLIMYLLRNACQRGKRIRNQECGDIKYYQKLDYLRL